MAERNTSARDKGKAKVGEPSREDRDLLSDNDDQTVDAFQENQKDDDPDMFTPLFKKPRTDDDVDEGHVPVVDDKIPQAADVTGPQMESQPQQVNIPHENPIIVPGAGSRDVSNEEFFISKTLRSQDVISENPRLILDDIEASIMADDNDVQEYPPGHMKAIVAFDKDDRRYSMKLSKQVSSGGRLRYALSGEWRQFVRLHDLKAGDGVIFYQVLDTNVMSNEFYYVLRVFRKPPKHEVYRRARGSEEKSSDGSEEKDSKGGGLVITVGKK